MEAETTDKHGTGLAAFVKYAAISLAVVFLAIGAVVLAGVAGDDYNGFDRCAYREAMENCLKVTRSDRDSTINNVFHCEQYARKYAMTAAETIKEGCYGERP